MSDLSNHFYSNNAEKVFSQYRSLNSKDIYQQVIEHFPVKAGLALDIGAGSGRDSDYLASLGCRVIAIEPSAGLRERAIAEGMHPNISFFESALPALEGVDRFVGGFDFVLCAAVLMHLDRAARIETLSRIYSLLKTGVQSRAVVTFKAAPAEPERAMFSLNPEEVADDMNALPFRSVSVRLNGDLLGRADTLWYTAVLYKDSLPGDYLGKLSQAI